MITSVTSCDCDLQRGTRGLRLLSHADATQTGWPQRIAAFPLRPISLSLSLLPNSAILAQDNLFRSQTVMFILFFFFKWHSDAAVGHIWRHRITAGKGWICISAREEKINGMPFQSVSL